MPAIVTGGNSGIGRACAVALARRGFDIGLTWHSDEANLEEVRSELASHGVRVEDRRADFEDVPGADAVVDELADALGGVDAFVANAAAGHSTPFLETDYETYARVLRLTLVAPFLCSQRMARRMVAEGRGGRIVHVTSVHEHRAARRPAATFRQARPRRADEGDGASSSRHGITVTRSPRARSPPR